MWILPDQSIHDFHGCIGFPDLVEGTRHLVEHFVIAFEVGVAFEDFLVGLDRFLRSGRNRFTACAHEQRIGLGHPAQQLLAAARAGLERRVRLVRFGAGTAFP